MLNALTALFVHEELTSSLASWKMDNGALQASRALSVLSHLPASVPVEDQAAGR